MTEIKRRRSLTNVGGAVETSGDEEEAANLAHAIDVAPETESEAPDRAHVHGFHAYPARAHPVTARRLVEAYCPPDGTVLDPFCGSGTILIEAMLAGRAAIGTDLNPLAVMLARAKTFPRGADRTAKLLEAAKGAADIATARRKAKSGAVKRLPQQDVAIFQPHVLLELDGIRAGIAKAPPESRPELSLVLSSILVKLSTKRGDTSDEEVEKRIGAGYPTKLFLKKAEELARRMEEFSSSLPAPPPHARVFLDDATKLTKVKDASIDAVITSPPYAVTYDYLAHHEMRMRWLDLDAKGLAKGEMGARRDYAKLTPTEAVRRWFEELSALFRTLARVTKPGANVVLLIADSATAPGPRGESSQRLPADEMVAEVAKRGRSFESIARASQARPHFHLGTAAAFRDKPRYEHALLLRRK